MSATVAAVAVTAECVGCGACIATCPERAFRAVRPAPGLAPLRVLADRCTGCLACIEICPADAITETGAPPTPWRVHFGAYMRQSAPAKGWGRGAGVDR